jgi:Tol biopolymer transport system component
VLKRLFDHCLEKDPSHRYQSIADVKIALEDLAAEDSPRSPVTQAAQGQPKRMLAVASVLFIVAAGTAIAWLLHWPKAAQAPLQLTQLTFAGRLAIHPAISADGKYVAYASDRSGQGNLDIWVQSLPHGEPVRLTKDATNEDYPSFSPDGIRLAYLSNRDGGSIYTIPVLGGAPRLLVRSRTQPVYSPDGKWVLLSPFTPSTLERSPGITIMPAQGGEPRRLQATPVGSLFAVWSPDAMRILYAHQPGIHRH